MKNKLSNYLSVDRNSKRWKLLMAGVLATTMATTTYAQSSSDKEGFTKEEISPNFNVEDAKINDLEDFLSKRLKIEEDITKKLKFFGLWSSDRAKALPSKPKPCGQKPNIILVNKREEYKDCLLTSIKQQNKRIGEMAALLPNKDVPVAEDKMPTVQDTIPVFQDTITNKDIVPNDLDQTTDVGEVWVKKTNDTPQPKKELPKQNIVKPGPKKDGEAMPF